MKIKLYLIVTAILFSNTLFCQTETCLQNLSNPDNVVGSQVVDSDTVYREFILKIPESYNENTPTPLIINFHGFGDCASDYSESIGDSYNFKELANAEEIIVVYPQAAYRPEKDDTYWEPGDIGVEDIYKNDVYFIETLIASLTATFNIDSEMVFACGYSNGGMMAYSLACNRSNLFSAIGIMSGTMLEEDCTLEQSVPIIKFHGIADDVLPYVGSLWYQSVQEVIEFWLDKNDIPENSLNSTQLNDNKVTLDAYSGGPNNSCINLYTIQEEYDKPGGHVWFSDDINGETPNRIMWNFFKNNCGSISASNEITAKKITSFPNPVKNQITIKNAINQSYAIYNVIGALVGSGTITSDIELISLAGMQNGSYVMRIGNQTIKILKLE